MTTHVLLAILFIVGAARGRPADDLVVNGDFETGTMADLPGWQGIPWGQDAQLDESVKHSGRRSIRVSAHGGMRTKLVVKLFKK